jgi:hypothetical protein
MKSIRNPSIIITVIMFLFFACESPSSNNEDQTVTLTGKVIDTENSTPIINAVIKVINISPEITEVTDSEGNFSVNFDLKESLNVQVIASKESYLPDTAVAMAVPGRTIELPLFQLSPTEDTPVISGGAASIILAQQSTDHIGVQESGSPETVQLVFEVNDSTGQPIDFSHSIEIAFSIGAGPGGGEFIFPSSGFTDNNGQVKAHLTSGTKAGVVQIIAEATIDTGLISSKPVSIAIYGGLPDLTHFSLAVEKLNFPGYNIYGLTDRITAYVGDKYSNPVRPNTAVWFNTDGGIIEGSSLTDLQGQASVNLISAAPRPTHPVYGTGFATIAASTVDENQSTINADAIVLFSGYPTISIQPSSGFAIPNGGSQTFIYTVSDQNGNPLSEGTSINVSVSGENIETLGTLDVDLPDTQSSSWTTFSFLVYDSQDTVTVVKPVSIEIATSGPNGGAVLGISGTSE